MANTPDSYEALQAGAAFTQTVDHRYMEKNLAYVKDGVILDLSNIKLSGDTFAGLKAITGVSNVGPSNERF